MGVVKRTPDPCFTSLQASFDYFCSALSLPMRLCHVDFFTQPSGVQRHAGVLGEMGWLGSWERENEAGHECPYPEPGRRSRAQHIHTGTDTRPGATAVSTGAELTFRTRGLWPHPYADPSGSRPFPQDKGSTVAAQALAYGKHQTWLLYCHLVK